MHYDTDNDDTPEPEEIFQQLPDVLAAQELTQESPANAEPPERPKRVDPLALAEAKLKQKEARLAESRNLLSQRKRKYRNSQLYVWGAMVESAYRHGDIEQRTLLKKLAETYLTDERHRERSGFGFGRLDVEREERKA